MKATKTTKETSHSEQQAIAQLASIKEMVKALREARDATEFGYYQGGEVTADDMEQRIHADPLCVEVRSDWHTPGDKEGDKSGEYNILLCWGGPACRITGDLSDYGEPETAQIEHQDWGTPWKNYPISGEDRDIVLDYARCFYFGE